MTGTGTVRLVSHRRAVQAAVARGATKGARKVAIDLQGQARRRTPVDTGRLRSSIAYRVEGGVAIVGTNVKYAVYVHENLNARHPTGQAKFLEEPALERSPLYRRWLRESMAEEVANAARKGAIGEVRRLL